MRAGPDRAGYADYEVRSRARNLTTSLTTKGMHTGGQYRRPKQKLNDQPSGGAGVVGVYLKKACNGIRLCIRVMDSPSRVQAA